MKKLKGKNIMITGASSGIGWATAEVLGKDGASLILCGRRESRLKELQAKLNTPSYILVFDVRDKKSF
tara:strand:+ start:872 stop:1075 length:204 start_codon:yes stop_codon:yes gene_type:complete